MEQKIYRPIREFLDKRKSNLSTLETTVLRY